MNMRTMVLWITAIATLANGGIMVLAPGKLVGAGAWHHRHG
jgi:hypothetical protein